MIKDFWLNGGARAPVYVLSFSGYVSLVSVTPVHAYVTALCISKNCYSFQFENFGQASLVLVFCNSSYLKLTFS